MKNSQNRFPRLCAISISVLLASSQFLDGSSARSWSIGPDLPSNLVRAAGVYFPANGRFYAMGGRTSDVFGSEMTTPYEYNPKSNSWAFKTAPFPDNQVCNMACGVLNAGKVPYIYCVGGTTGGGATTSTPRVFRYDPIADKVETVGIDAWNESVPNTVPGGAAVVQNKLYVLGGLSIATEATNRIYEFTPDNPVGSQWTQKAATLPVALSYVPVTAIGNLIFTAGGSSFVPCQLTETTNSYVYDPVKDVISPIASIPRAAGETQAVTIGDEMWVVGGGRTAPHPSTEVNIYNPLRGQWRAGVPMSAGRRNFPMGSDGVRLFLAGGYDSSTVPQKTAQIYGDVSR